MSDIAPQIEESWKQALQQEFGKQCFPLIKQFIVSQKEKGKTIYPKGSQIFNAFNLTPFNKVKVVILGQDPYHGPGQAHGLSFSVPMGVKPPPSLVNIYKELRDDINFNIPNHGNLEKWAHEGVLLLNAVLTVNAGEAASHKSAGWETFTDAVIKTISEEKEHVVFMLWGNFAKGKEHLIDTSKHLVLKAAHPSPLAGGAFNGSKHFSKANTYLQSKGLAPINWQL